MPAAHCAGSLPLRPPLNAPGYPLAVHGNGHRCVAGVLKIDTIRIRPAELSDAPVLTVIRNWAADETVALFDDSHITATDQADWIASSQEQGFPIIVAENEAGTVVGYASCGTYRAYSGYRHTVENSVYVLPGNQGHGIGTALLSAVLDHARTNPAVHRVVAWIEAGNAASIALHVKSGFTVKGTLSEAGWKFGRWLDVTVLELAV